MNARLLHASRKKVGAYIAAMFYEAKHEIVAVKGGDKG
jgi:hypothetical protein